MAITNPTQVQFINSRIRPIAESLVRQQYKLNELVAYWNASGLGSAIPNDANEVVQDPRPVVLITGADVHSVVSRSIGLRDYLAQPFYMDVLHKASVRDLDLIVN